MRTAWQAPWPPPTVIAPALARVTPPTPRALVLVGWTSIPPPPPLQIGNRLHARVVLHVLARTAPVVSPAVSPIKASVAQPLETTALCHVGCRMPTPNLKIPWQSPVPLRNSTLAHQLDRQRDAPATPILSTPRTSNPRQPRDVAPPPTRRSAPTASPAHQPPGATVHVPKTLPVPPSLTRRR